MNVVCALRPKLLIYRMSGLVQSDILKKIWGHLELVRGKEVISFRVTDEKRASRGGENVFYTVNQPAIITLKCSIPSV